MRTACVLVLLAAVSSAALGGEEPSNQPPLHQLARDLSKGEEARKTKALEALVKRKDVWAYDLLARYAPDDMDTAKRHIIACFTALLQSHYFEREQTRVALESLWRKATPKTMGQKGKILEALKKAFQPKRSGLVTCCEVPKRRRVLISVLSPDDAFDMSWTLETYFGSVGHLLPPPDDAKVTETLNALRTGKGEIAAGVRRNLDKINESAKKRKDFAAKLAPRVTELLNDLRAQGEKSGWRKFLPGKWHQICAAMSLDRPEEKQRAAKASKADEAVEDLVLSVVRQLGRNAAPDWGKVRSDPAKATAFWAYMRPVSLCAWVAGNPRLHQRSTSSLAGSIDYARLHGPFACFVADVCCREGDRKAGAFLVKSLRAASRTKAFLAFEQALQLTEKPERSAAIKELDLSGLFGDVWSLTQILLVTRPQHNGFAEERTRLLRLSKMRLRLRDNRSAEWVDQELRQLRRKLEDLCGLRQPVIAWKNGKLPKPQRERRIKKLKADYAAKKITFGDMLHQLEELDALNDPWLLGIYKEDPKARRSVFNEMAVCKLIGNCGGPEDGAYLNSYWLSPRLDIREAMVAAAEKKSYRRQLDMVTSWYPRMRQGSRRIYGLLLWKVSSPKDVDITLKRMTGEKDQEAVGYFALAIRRHCTDPKKGKEVLAKVAEVLKRDPYGRRWFYLASVLRSLAPAAELELDPDTKAGSPERTKQVDAAVAAVSRALKAQPGKK